MKSFYLFLAIPLFLIGEGAIAACSDVPLSGDYIMSTSCTFGGMVNGVENGNLTISEGETLTINAGQTVVWNAGYNVFINGSIAINSLGAQLRKSNIWFIDADDDYYPNKVQKFVAQETQPENGTRRSDSEFVSKFTYVNDVAYDYDDLNDTVFPGQPCNGSCTVNLSDGTCGIAEIETNPGSLCTTIGCGKGYCKGAVAECDYYVSGSGNCSTCQHCNGATSVVCLPYTDYSEQAGCNSACKGCYDGSCVNIPDNTQDNIGSNKCDSTVNTCSRCLSGSCTYQDSSQDLANECASGTCGNGNCSGLGYSCGTYNYANGTACTADCACASGYCGTDSDNDGYFSQALSHIGTCQTSKPYTDCYDSNANAKPGQASWFTSHRGDGSFDYNCDGATTKYYGQTATSCYLENASPYCSHPTVGACYRASVSYSTSCGQLLQGCYAYGLNSSCVSISRACYPSGFCGYGYGVQGGGLCNHDYEQCH
jgi:hypothetical protein